MDATIIISSYNQSHTILQSIERIVAEAQMLKKQVQIVIADDGSNLYDTEFIGLLYCKLTL